MIIEHISALLLVMGGICSVLCIAYPLAALIWYPFYRRIFNSKITLREYMRGL